MTDYLLDTNHLTALAEPTAPLWSRMFAAIAAGDRFHVCPVSVGEAGIWADGGRRQDRRASRLRAVRTRLRYIPLTEADADESARLHLNLRTTGRQLAPPDALIAAVALRRGLTLLTSDQDFAPVPHLRTADWLAP